MIGRLNDQHAAEHIAMIAEAAKSGDPTSSMQRGIAALRRQIEAIKTIRGLK